MIPSEPDVVFPPNENPYQVMWMQLPVRRGSRFLESLLHTARAAALAPAVAFGATADHS